MMQLKSIYPKVCAVTLIIVILAMMIANDRVSLARGSGLSTSEVSVTMAATWRFPSCPANIATQSPTQAASLVATIATMLPETALQTELVATASQPTLTPTLPPTPILHAGMGIQVEQVDQCGARILSIRPDGTAAKTNLQVGDVIVAVDGIQITGLTTLAEQIRTHDVGDNVILTVQRETQQIDVRVTLGLLAPLPTTTPQPGATVSATDETLQ